MIKILNTDRQLLPKVTKREITRKGYTRAKFEQKLYYDKMHLVTTISERRRLSKSMTKRRTLLQKHHIHIYTADKQRIQEK